MRDFFRNFLYPPQPYRRVFGVCYLALCALWIVISFRYVGNVSYAVFAMALGVVSIVYLWKRG